MRTSISYVIIAIIAFSLGYFTYPELNQNNSTDNQIATSPTESTEHKPKSITKQNTQTKAIVTTSQQEQNTDVKPDNTTSGMAPTESDDQLAIIEDFPEENYEQQATKAEKGELVQWASEHKSELSELINAHVPSQIAENMFKQVSDGNEFLTAPEMKQPPELDSNWAYNMEQELTAYINNHTNADGFDLIKVSCKQLTCDVLGTEKENQAWIKIYFSMFKNVPNINPPNSSGSTKSLSYINGDGTSSIYFQLEFVQS